MKQYKHKYSNRIATLIKEVPLLCTTYQIERNIHEAATHMFPTDLYKVPSDIIENCNDWEEINK